MLQATALGCRVHRCCTNRSGPLNGVRTSPGQTSHSRSLTPSTPDHHPHTDRNAECETSIRQRTCYTDSVEVPAETPESELSNSPSPNTPSAPKMSTGPFETKKETGAESLLLCTRSVSEEKQNSESSPSFFQSSNPPHSALRPGHGVGRHRFLRGCLCLLLGTPTHLQSPASQILLRLSFLQKIVRCLLQFPPERKHCNPPGPTFPSEEGTALSPGPKVGGGSWTHRVSGTQKDMAMDFLSHMNTDALALPGLVLLKCQTKQGWTMEGRSRNSPGSNVAPGRGEEAGAGGELVY